ncbi:hypothetical protein [Burkholderia sp. BCC0322]|nr:hypothetical protein [Burkholderia sp. BCC0322]
MADPTFIVGDGKRILRDARQSTPWGEKWQLLIGDTINKSHERE